MQILAFSDLHGDAATLKLLKDRIKEESYDYMLVAGDLTNADLLPSPKAVQQQVKEIFSVMESFKIPYYYVLGIPFREGVLAPIVGLAEKSEEYEIKEQESSILFQRRIGNLVDTIRIPKAEWQPLKEIQHVVSSLTFGKHLKEEPVKFGEYWLTSSPKRIPKNAIFLSHCYRRIIPEALIQLDGHVHYGQHALNYLNLGFLYRDAEHGAPPMVGCYWKLVLKGSSVSVNFINLGNKLKEFNCPAHPEEGTFYIPFYWKKCPVCFDPRNSLFKKDKISDFA
jgi:hypothetical protein